MDKNIINWFEIPAADFDRAKSFYEYILECDMEVQDMQGVKMGMLPYEIGSGKVSGAVCSGDGYQPGMSGPLLYLNGNPNLQSILDRIPSAGGQVVVPKTRITEEIGHFAIFMDTEGNKMALHSQE